MWSYFVLEENLSEILDKDFNEYIKDELWNNVYSCNFSLKSFKKISLANSVQSGSKIPIRKTFIAKIWKKYY
jgi:hypothetical protein